MDTGDLPRQDSPAAVRLDPAHGVPDPTGEGDGRELARVLETMPAAFCFLDPGWSFRYVNARAEELLGHSRADLLGRSIWEALPRIVGTVHEMHYRSAVDTGQAAA